VNRNRSRVCRFLMAVFSISPLGGCEAGDDRTINPDWLFDTPGHRRTAEPSDPRVYPSKANGEPDRSKLPVWIGGKDGSEYQPKANEVTAFHKALDISSRVTPDQPPSEMSFKAGVYGTVIIAKPGRIGVLLDNGNCIVYNHISEFGVGIGDKVTPTTVLGKTGNLGNDGRPISGMAIHLHIQAADPRGRIIDPDQAFLGGRREPKPKNATNIKPREPEWADAGPIYLDDPGKRPLVVNGTVKADSANKSHYYATDDLEKARKQAREDDEKRKQIEKEYDKP
jgi:hypothetical protein